MLTRLPRKHGQPCGAAVFDAADRLGGGPADGPGVLAEVDGHGVGGDVDVMIWRAWALPHLEPTVADDHLRVRDPERLKPKYLVRIIADEPQASSFLRNPGHGHRSSAGMPVTCRARCRSTANSSARSCRR
jgi:hypothetical protein